MSLSPTLRQEISELASRATDGSLDSAGHARLEECLRQSAEARAFYVRYMAVSAGLVWAARNGLGEPISAANPATEKASKSAAGYPSWRIWAQMALAASVLLVAFAGAWIILQKPQPAPGKGDNAGSADAGIATLTMGQGIEWDQDQEPRHVGNVLKSGWLRMNAGLAEVEFISGTDVWIEGPAAFRLDSAKQGYLESGKMVVQVPHGSDGFQVDLPYGRVVDRGTAFGVDLQPNAATVHVLEGSVVVTPTDGEAMTYVAGQAVTLSAKSAVQVAASDPKVFDDLGYGWNGNFVPLNSGMGPGQGGHWKGYDRLEAIRAQLDMAPDRWAIIKPMLAPYIDSQVQLRCLGFVSEENDFSRAAWDLYYGTQMPDITDNDLKSRLAAFRNARQVLRDRRDQQEKDLIDLLTIHEEAQLVDLGYLR